MWVPGTVQALDLATAGVTFSDIALGELRPSHVEAWVKSMQEKPLAPSTIKTRFNYVRSVLKAAKRDKVLGEDPTERITLPRHRRADAAMRIPEPLQVGSLVRSSDDDFRAFVALAAFAGLRLGEAAALRIKTSISCGARSTYDGRCGARTAERSRSARRSTAASETSPHLQDCSRSSPSTSGYGVQRPTQTIGSSLERTDTPGIRTPSATGGGKRRPRPSKPTGTYTTSATSSHPA